MNLKTNQWAKYTTNLFFPQKYLHFRFFNRKWKNHKVTLWKTVLFFWVNFILKKKGKIFEMFGDLFLVEKMKIVGLFFHEIPSLKSVKKYRESFDFSRRFCAREKNKNKKCVWRIISICFCVSGSSHFSVRMIFDFGCDSWRVLNARLSRTDEVSINWLFDRINWRVLTLGVNWRVLLVAGMPRVSYLKNNTFFFARDGYFFEYRRARVSVARFGSRPVASRTRHETYLYEEKQFFSHTFRSPASIHFPDRNSPRKKIFF